MLNLLKQFARPYMRNFILGPICKLLEVLFDLLTPLVIALMIDRGVGEHNLHAVFYCGAMLAFMACVGFGFTLVCQKMASLASQGLGTDVRAALFEHINSLSYADLDKLGTPTLITRITGDVNQVQLAVALGIRQLVRFPLLALGSMIAALLIDTKLGLIFLVATPLVGMLFWLVMAKCVPYFKRMQQKLDRIALITREGLSGARVVRAFVREEHERERFGNEASSQASIAIAAGRLSSMLNPATFLIMNIAVCAILWQGGIQVNVGNLTQGQVMAFVNYMTQTLLAIVYVANLVVVFTKASASASRVLEVLSYKPSINQFEGEQFGDVLNPVCDMCQGDFLSATRGRTQTAASRIAKHVPGCAAVAQLANKSNTSNISALRMAHVSFSFDGASGKALNNISFELAQNQTLGIIGGTGSGKSTLVNLIPRFCDATQGEVEVLGSNVRDWDLKKLRHAIGIVPQKAQLVSGTIRSNLMWQNPDALDEDLWRALEIAQAADFVRALPLRLNASVESGGKNFSGGQRQRLSIARALVGNPKMLILDDSASALDFKTDSELRKSIAELDLTTVIVSQRVSSVRDANLICVLYHGEIAGLGTHEELMASCSIYREIAESQLKARAEEVSCHA